MTKLADSTVTTKNKLFSFDIRPAWHRRGRLPLSSAHWPFTDWITALDAIAHNAIKIKFDVSLYIWYESNSTE